MSTRIITDGLTSRRAFLGGVAAVAAGGLLARRGLAAAGKPNSTFGGVRIGCITYSFRGGKINTAQETLDALIQCGLSNVELMGGPIQSFMGKGDRASQLEKCRELRKMYNDAGVNIHIHKMGFGKSDEDVDFAFEVAKAIGAIGITTERNDAAAKRLAPFADKHKIWVAFHNHTGNVPVMDKKDPILEYGQYIGYNFDIGHYVAGTKGKSPIPVIEKYHDRMVSLHLKDRTADGKNLPWGQGTTPIKEVLQLIRKEKWTFPADIELEYKVPADSNSVAEVAKCVQFCKEALA